ncbi:MAG TPA: DUF934 domain-containing protein [Steroidobacteraceae bacterium]|nr:DUF934 domain-containing protein [Steroidobacteraceae bacterium]
MAKLLRLPEAGPHSAIDPELPLIKQADFLKDPASHAGSKSLGVRVAPADKVEDLAPHLAGIAVVAIEFPSPGDGRGFTSARLLRQRYAFTGEIRAIGAGVKQDLLFFMTRCGIDAFELVATENEAEARAALNRFTLAYQPAVPRTAVREARFTAARR